MEDKTNIEQVSLDDVADKNTTDVETEISETESLQNQIEQLNDKYIRCLAELENTRRRSALDSENMARNRGISVSRNFLPVIDAIEAALAHSPDDSGIIAMQGAAESACAKTGIVKIESVGEILNPTFHNAVQAVEMADKKPNEIIEQLQTGYMFGDTVLRPAMVIVAK